jgi:hypothetical protein
MNKFEREITIVIKGETSESLSDEELFRKLKIDSVHWWQNPNWPYGRPCKELLGTEILEVKLKD